MAQHRKELLGKKFFWERKKSYCKKRNFFRTKNKKQRKKLSFPFSIFIRTKPNPNQKQSFFFFPFSFKNSIQVQQEATISIFKTKLHIKTVNTLWRENQYCINISFLLLSLLFLIILFKFIVDSIYFLFGWLFYILIILFSFYIFDGWNDVSLPWGFSKIHGMPWI